MKGKPNTCTSTLYYIVHSPCSSFTYTYWIIENKTWKTILKIWFETKPIDVRNTIVCKKKQRKQKWNHHHFRCSINIWKIKKSRWINSRTDVFYILWVEIHTSIHTSLRTKSAASSNNNNTSEKWNEWIHNTHTDTHS